MSKNHEIQKLIRHYKQETGTKEVELKQFAKWAVEHGYPLPKPVDPIDQLARTFASAAREETREDSETGAPYRVNHMYVVTRGDQQLHLWVDIDEAPRGPMHASLTMRREQVVGDVAQLSFDAEHWNRINPGDEPINIETDFAMDLELRRLVPREG